MFFGFVLLKIKIIETMTDHETESKSEILDNFIGYDLGETNYYVYLINEEIVCSEPTNESIEDGNEFADIVCESEWLFIRK